MLAVACAPGRCFASTMFNGQKSSAVLNEPGVSCLLLWIEIPILVIHFIAFRMDVDQIRKKTRGVNGKLFFNSAGSSLMQDEVMQTMLDYLQEEQLHGGYSTAISHQKLVAQFYTELARLLQTNERNIAFASSAGDAYSQALSCIPFERGDVILTTNNDYISNQLSFLSVQKRYAVQVVRCQDAECGGLDQNDCIEKIQTLRPRLVAITHIPTSSGLVQNINSIGAICKALNIFYLVDSCQSVGQIKIIPAAVQCDFLTGTGRKFMRGPRGTGFLYVSDRIISEGLHPLFLDQAGAEWTVADEFKLIPTARRFERWEKNHAALAGLGTATKLINDLSIEKIEERNIELQLLLREGLSQNKKIKCTDIGDRLCNIITFSSVDGSTEAIEKLFKAHHIYYSISGINSALLDFSERKIKQVVRLSPHYFNTEEEIVQLLKVLELL